MLKVQNKVFSFKPPSHDSKNQPECRRNENSLLFLTYSWQFVVWSRHPYCIPAICARSFGWPESFWHVKNREGAFEVEKYQMAFKVVSKCIQTILTALWPYYAAFQHYYRNILISFDGELKWQAILNPVRMWPKEYPECSKNFSNTVRISKNRTNFSFWRHFGSFLLMWRGY